jgi:hypothetical protein
MRDMEQKKNLRNGVCRWKRLANLANSIYHRLGLKMLMLKNEKGRCAGGTYLSDQAGIRLAVDQTYPGAANPVSGRGDGRFVWAK